ncbi:MAG: FAD-binding oxidoreductase [Candidatus Hydrothermales bacterium]
MKDDKICVIGSGIAGIMTLYFLDKFGSKKLTIFDKEVLASGTTGKSAGIVVTHLFDELDIELSKRTIKILDEIDKKSKYKFLKKFQTVTGLINDREKAKIESLLKKKFIEFETLTLKDIKKIYPLFKEEKTYIVSDDGLYVDVGELLYSIYVYLKSKNHEFRFFNEVEGFEIKQNRVKSLITKRGKFYFDKYLIATGIWSKEILKKHDIKINVKPYRTQAAILEFKREIDLPIYNDLSYGIYLRKELKKDVLIGDGTERKESDIYNFKSYNDEEFLFSLSEKLPKILDGAEEFLLKGGWAFLCLATPDKKPIVSKVEDIENLFLFCGFNGLGIMRAPALSEILAECIIDNLPLPKEFSLERFKDLKDFEIKEGFYPD